MLNEVLDKSRCFRTHPCTDINIKCSCQLKEQTSYLKVWLCETSRHGDHGGSKRTRDTDGGQELRDVWCQAEWNGTVSIQVACGVVDVKAEVGDIQLPRVLKCI